MGGQGFVSCLFVVVLFWFVLQSANTNKNMRDGEQVLDADEFVMFYMNLMSRSEVQQLFERYKTFVHVSSLPFWKSLSQYGCQIMLWLCVDLYLNEEGTLKYVVLLVGYEAFTGVHQDANQLGYCALPASGQSPVYKVWHSRRPEYSSLLYFSLSLVCFYILCCCLLIFWLFSLCVCIYLFIFLSQQFILWNIHTCMHM